MKKNDYKEYIIEKVSNGRVAIVTDIHNCHINWYDTENSIRMELLCDFLNKQHETKPFDCILTLGDYSLDFWQWDIGGSYLHEPPVSNTDVYVKEYCRRFPADTYMIPGNHEQYGKEDWERITGHPREYSLVYGNIVFAMLDTFGGDLDPKVNSDGTYTGINTDLLEQIIKSHPNKMIMLCMHDLIPSHESEKARQLIAGNEQIVCAFAGHIHEDKTLILPDDWRRLPVFYCGDFSYSQSRGGDKNWGCRLLEKKDNTFSTEYIRCNV
ncbi:MAG: hypothetical protein E7623_00475 [Ruminococcaceae bacterium]|nr:hypothetical protein [Oscillospiraceae bacterium]